MKATQIAEGGCRVSRRRGCALVFAGGVGVVFVIQRLNGVLGATADRSGTCDAKCARDSTTAQSRSLTIFVIHAMRVRCSSRLSPWSGRHAKEQGCIVEHVSQELQAGLLS